MSTGLQPRLVRLKDAPGYLGIDRNTFNRLVRPDLKEVRFGRAVLFDRVELDGVADSWLLLNRCGSPSHDEEHLCKRNRETESPALQSGAACITQGRGSEWATKLSRFRKALAVAN
jgi:hypothetical protein